MKSKISLPGVVVEDPRLYAVQQTEVKLQNVSHMLSNGGVGKHLEWSGVLNVVQLQEDSL